MGQSAATWDSGIIAGCPEAGFTALLGTTMLATSAAEVRNDGGYMIITSCSYPCGSSHRVAR